MYQLPFAPLANNAYLTAPTTTSSSVSLNVPTGEPAGEVVRVLNDTDKTVFIRFGISTVTATALTDTPLPPGAIETFLLQNTFTHVAGIVETGTASGKIHFQLGRGI